MINKNNIKHSLHNLFGKKLSKNIVKFLNKRASKEYN